MIAKAKLKVLTGEVVNKKKAANHAYLLGRSIRDLVLSFPVRYGAVIASELGTDEHTTTVVLENMLENSFQTAKNSSIEPFYVEKFIAKEFFRGLQPDIYMSVSDLSDAYRTLSSKSAVEP